jgi:Mg-chelatase subunit ChlD
VTRERKEELVALALAVSLALHALVMFYVKPKVMTNVARGFARVVHREPMRVAVTGPMPESALIERPAEADAVKDAPAARDMEFSAAPEPTSETPAADGKALAAVSAPELSGPEEAPASFDISPPDLGPKPVSAAIPVVEIRAPAPEMAAPPAGSGTEALKPPASPAADFSQAAFSAGGVDPDSLFAPAVLGRRADDRSAESPAGETGEKKPEFKPAEEVFETVDEKAVEREREAVKSLLEADGAEELERFADAQLVAAGDGEWTYFKVMISPRSSLPVVPKDAVVLIDASGSIGRDRMASVRPAAKKLLRSLTNTGDRFNLVAFRDRYQYAFRRWQECSRTSFDRAERWIDNLAAHGRTDVFATIRSVLTLPRDPGRPLVALVVTDGDANSGVSETAEIISRFTALNDGLVSLYMYGV